MRTFCPKNHGHLEYNQCRLDWLYSKYSWILVNYFPYPIPVRNTIGSLLCCLPSALQNPLLLFLYWSTPVCKISSPPVSTVAPFHRSIIRGDNWMLAEKLCLKCEVTVNNLSTSMGKQQMVVLLRCVGRQNMQPELLREEGTSHGPPRYMYWSHCHSQRPHCGYDKALTYFYTFHTSDEMLQTLPHEYPVGLYAWESHEMMGVG